MNDHQHNKPRAQQYGNKCKENQIKHQVNTGVDTTSKQTKNSIVNSMLTVKYCCCSRHGVLSL